MRGQVGELAGLVVRRRRWPGRGPPSARGTGVARRPGDAATPAAPCAGCRRAAARSATGRSVRSRRCSLGPGETDRCGGPPRRLAPRLAACSVTRAAPTSAPDRSSAWSAARRCAASPTSPARCPIVDGRADRPTSATRRDADRPPPPPPRRRPDHRRPAAPTTPTCRSVDRRRRRRHRRCHRHRRAPASPTATSRVVEATTAPVTERRRSTTAPRPAAARQRPADRRRTPAASGSGRCSSWRSSPPAATVVARAHDRSIEIDPPPDGDAPEYVVNDFGTNNTVAALLAAGDDGGRRARLVLRLPLGRRAGRRRRRGARRLGRPAASALAEWRHRHRRGRRRRRRRSPATSATGRWWRPAALGVLVLLGSLARAGPRRPSRPRPVDRRPRRGVVPHRRRRTADPAGHGRLVRQLQLRHARCRPADAVLRRARSCSSGCWRCAASSGSCSCAAAASAWRSAAPSPPAGCWPPRRPSRRPARSDRPTRTRARSTSSRTP